MVFHCRCFSFSSKEPNNLRVFTVSQLKAATGNFHRASKIGRGRFGSVYKGVIKSLEHPFHDIQVAVKVAEGLLQGLSEWEAEIKVLLAVEHPNLVKLIGYCGEDDELFLVYEYMVNGSVRDHLSTKSETPLSWNMRLKVAQDAASGLKYLHEEMGVQVILRDFKSSSILLDDQWNAKLADFGLAMLRPQVEHISTEFVGTMAYASQEYISEGPHSSKSDVWSYGVFLYELITGRRPLDRECPTNEQDLIEWVKPYLESIRFPEIIDPRLEGDQPLESAQMLSRIAECCLLTDPNSRPDMSDVLVMVRTLIAVPSQVVNPVEMGVNDSTKDSIDTQLRLMFSCLSCFRKTCCCVS